MPGFRVDFRAIAGGQYDCLRDAVHDMQLGQGASDTVACKNDLLAYFDRRRVMVQPENKQWHKGTSKFCLDNQCV